MSRNLTDDGFSLVEMIIAMFILAVISLAVLPLLIGAMQTSVVNRDHVEATTFANAQLAELRDGFPLESSTTSCATLTTHARSAANAVVDPAGTGMTATVEIAACPTAFPASVHVTVKIHDQDGDEITRLDSRIRVGAS